MGDELIRTLNSGIYSDFKAAVAYLKNSGVSRIYDDLANFSNNGGRTSIIAGIDQCTTSYQSLVNLLTFTQDELFIHHDKNFNITFHPKVYIFSNDNIEKIIIGSSNLTAGGLYLNYEANVGITLDQSEKGNELRAEISTYWENLINDENTKKADLPFLDMLLEYGSLADETRQRQFESIIERISNSPFKSKRNVNPIPPGNTQISTTVPTQKDSFAMTLSGFDVSPRSSDPVILIPIVALRMLPNFWNWPYLYTDSGAGYPQLYAHAKVIIDGRTVDQNIRIYYYDRKREFRLQCESIKRNGHVGDIISIQKQQNRPLDYLIELIRMGEPRHSLINRNLTNRASPQKQYNYY